MTTFIKQFIKQLILFASAILFIACPDPNRNAILVDLISVDGPPPLVDSMQIIVKDGTEEIITDFDFGETRRVPSNNNEERFAFFLDFLPELEDKTVQIEIIGLQNGVNVLSGVIEEPVTIGGGLQEKNVFVVFCGNLEPDSLRNEECDDGNNFEGDGCDSNCTVTACGNGIFSPGELCFADEIRFPIEGNVVRAVITGDFNNDNLLDLATTIADDTENPPFRGVGIFLGNGDGSFQEQKNVAVSIGNSRQSLATTDLNGDSFLDLVSTGTNSFPGGEISILFGNGDSSFQQPINSEVPISPFALVIEDLNQDNSPDIAIAGIQSQFTNILESDNAESFTILTDFEAFTASETAIATGNFDNDNFLDLVIANLGAIEDVVITFGDLFSDIEREQISLEIKAEQSSFLQSVTVNDFNRNGLSDIAIVDARSNEVILLLSKGDRTFQDPIRFTVGVNPGFVSSSDLNLDGIPDLAVSNRDSDNVSILLGNGDGTFQPQRSFQAGQEVDSLVIGDFTNDGFLDIVTINETSNDISLLIFEP